MNSKRDNNDGISGWPKKIYCGNNDGNKYGNNYGNKYRESWQKILLQIKRNHGNNYGNNLPEISGRQAAFPHTAP